MKFDIDYQRYNMFRRPDWRWERVMRMCRRHPTPGRCTKRDDDYIKQARNFYLRWRSRTPEQREELFHERPGLYYAYEIYEKAHEFPDDSLLIEARLLTTMSYNEIADAADTIPDTIEWYEALFFNVRDKLKARDWITKQVLLPAMERNLGLSNVAKPGDGDEDEDEDDGTPASATPVSPWVSQVIAKPFLDASLKMFAYFGGPILCEFMLHGFQQGKTVTSPDNLTEFLDSHWALTLRARSAQSARTFEINKFNVMELFALHSRIIEVEKSEDSIDQKRNTIERHVSALISELQDIWAVGDDGRETFKDTQVASYDESAAELRDDELLNLAGGQEVKTTDGLELLALPAPPRKKEGPAVGQ